MKMCDKKIQIIFPGVGYHCDKPLLYYGRRVAQEAGYGEYINISYSCPVDRIRGDEAKMKAAFEDMYSQAEEQLKDIPWDEYDHILYVSKSIGTAIAAMYAAKHMNRPVKQLLYTPLVETFNPFEGKKDIDAMAFIGTKDPWSDVSKVVDRAKELGIPIHIYEGANHSLETDDTLSNLQTIKDVMDKSRKYLQ